VSAGWIAGTVRARALSRRRLGHTGARSLLAADTPRAGIELLARSPYGRYVRADDSVAAATRGVAATLLWNVRVLAGWLPARGAEMLRVLTGWFEIANVEEHLRELAGLPAEPPFSLGALATTWPRLAATGSRDELRAVLTTSGWGDPGGAAPRDVQLAMRLAWVERVVGQIPTARTWARGGAALLVARELLVHRQPLSDQVRASAARILGARWSAASSLETLHDLLPGDARWVLRDIYDVDRLWEAEARWWHRLRTDCSALVARSRFGPEPVVGAVGLLAFDAWLVTGALAGSGRGDSAVEVFDALA
jgi:hypothetical protein